MKTLPFALVSLLLLLPVSSPVTAQTPEHNFNLDSLFTVSVGGPEGVERLKKLKNFRAVGDVTLSGMSGRFEIVAAMPDKMYMRLNLGPIEVAQAYDGDIAWQQDFNGAISQMSGFEKKELVSQAYFLSASYMIPDRMPGGIEYRGELRSDSATYHEIWFYPLDSDTLVYFYNTETGLPDWSKTQMDNIEAVTYSSDYRSVEGVLTAFRSFTVGSVPGLSSDFVIDTIAFDINVDSNLFASPNTAPDDFVFPDGVDSVVVPFRFENGHIYLPVTINGSLVGWMILDSGASANLYHAPVVDSLKLPVTGSQPAMGIAGFVDVSFVRIDSLALGDLRLYSQVAGSIDLSMIAQEQIEGHPFCGILGHDFLSRFPVCVKYDKQELIVYNPTRYNLPSDGMKLPFRFTLQVPTIEASISGIKGDFLIDLGNALGLVLHAGFASHSGLIDSLKNVSKVPGSAIGGIGGESTGEKAFAPDFKIGHLTYDSVLVLITEPSMGLSGSTELAGNIGSQILRDYHLILDYDRQTVVFMKP